MAEGATYLRDMDIYLFHRGEAERAYLTFGCHLLQRGPTPEEDAYLFVVWAPNAAGVSVVGDFNAWDPQATPAHQERPGIWVATASGLHDGSLYKYAITTKQAEQLLKADPFAFHAESGLATASKVWNLEGYDWHDADYLRERSRRNVRDAPMSIYEVHLGSWRLEPGRPFPSYRQAGAQLARYCRQMGYTHVEFMPLTEYPLPASWGYQVTGYFAPTSRYGTPQDFMGMIDALHAAGIGVILDWVPAHFPKDDWALARFDGAPLFEYEDPRKGEHAEWGTLVFDYEKPEVVSFLVSSATFFFDVYHIDGIRVDAVSSMLYLDYGRTEWVPNRDGGNINLEAVEFLRTLNSSILQAFPGAMTIAEESTAFPLVTYPPADGGLGFSFKWDMGFMHDSLEYFQMDPLFRCGNHDKLTFGLMYAFSENFVLAYSHDEVVHGKRSMLDKMSGSYEQKFATLKALMGFQFGRPGKKLTFMGGEFGQFIEWNFQQQLDWMLLEYPAHEGLQRFSAALNRLYAQQPALWQQDESWAGFAWSNVNDCDESALAFLRYARDGWEPRGGEGADEGAAGESAAAAGEGAPAAPAVLVCCNFTPNPLRGFTVGLPCEGTLMLLLDSDDASFGTSLIAACADASDAGFDPAAAPDAPAPVSAGASAPAEKNPAPAGKCPAPAEPPVTAVLSKATSFEGLPHSAKVNLPPLSAVYYAFRPAMGGQSAKSESRPATARDASPSASDRRGEQA